MVPQIKYPFIVLAVICLLAGAAFVYHAVKFYSLLSWAAAVVCIAGAYFAAKHARLW